MKKYVGILFLSMIFLGCGLRLGQAPKPAEGYGRVGFLGFVVPITSPQGQVLVQEPIGGTHHYAEYVPPEVREELETMVWEELTKKYKMEFLSVDQLRPALGIELAKGYGKNALEVLVDLGRANSLDALIVGHVYRLKEREGSDFAVASPASISFDLFLIDVQKKTVVARSLVDWTQRSLSENLLGIKELMASGFRWAKVRTLAKAGITRALNEILGPVQE